MANFVPKEKGYNIDMLLDMTTNKHRIASTKENLRLSVLLQNTFSRASEKFHMFQNDRTGQIVTYSKNQQKALTAAEARNSSSQLHPVREALVRAEPPVNETFPVSPLRRAAKVPALSLGMVKPTIVKYPAFEEGLNNVGKGSSGLEERLEYLSRAAHEPLYVKMHRWSESKMQKLRHQINKRSYIKRLRRALSPRNRTRYSRSLFSTQDAVDSEKQVNEVNSIILSLENLSLT